MIKVKLLKSVRYKGMDIAKDEVIEIEKDLFSLWVKSGLCIKAKGKKIGTEKGENNKVNEDKTKEDKLTDEQLLEQHVEEINGVWYTLKTGEKIQGEENALKRIKELLE